jgi:hypothetical protein
MESQAQPSRSRRFQCPPPTTSPRSFCSRPPDQPWKFEGRCRAPRPGDLARGELDPVLASRRSRGAPPGGTRQVHPKSTCRAAGTTTTCRASRPRANASCAIGRFCCATPTRSTAALLAPIALSKSAAARRYCHRDRSDAHAAPRSSSMTTTAAPSSARSAAGAWRGTRATARSSSQIGSSQYRRCAAPSCDTPVPVHDDRQIYCSVECRLAVKVATRREGRRANGHANGERPCC